MYNRMGVSVALLFLAAVASQAQTVQGVVTGTVSDSSGAVLPNASVTLTNEGTNVTQQAITGADGIYRFSLVPPGEYMVSVKASGFTQKDVRGVTVNASQTVPLNVTLSVATASSTVEVVSQAALVQTATSDLGSTVNQNTIINTPLLTRNVFDLAFVAPQVMPGMNFGPASGGARESGTAYLLNGADNNDNFGEGAANVTPPLESVAEFTILTNSFGSQFGRGAGAIVSAIQKSGTNSLHGSLYEFHRDRNISANDFFSNRNGQDKPKYIRNQFGGEVDGPIRKDKTFFSFAFDRVDSRTGSNLYIQVPTAAELQAMSAGAGPLAQYYLQKYPLRTSETPCVQSPESAIGRIGCYSTFDPNTTGQNVYYGRVDQNFSSNDRLSFTANITRYENRDAYGGNTASATVEPYPYVDAERYHHLALVETHTFNPRVLNELTIAQNRHYSNAFEGNGKFTDPEIYIDGADTGLGFSIGPNSNYVVTAFTQDRWQIQDNLGWTAGKHSFKFGGGWQYGQLYRNWDLGGPGFYEFANTTGTAAPVLNSNGTIGDVENGLDYNASNFQRDYPYYQEIAIDPTTGAKANAYRHYIGQDSNVFVSDDWKISRRLTLNLGLRWEHYGAPREVNGILSQFTNLSCLSTDCIANAVVGPVNNMWKIRWKDFGPRIGFAWDIFGNGRMSVRGGYGIFYDRIFDNVWSNGAWNPPFYALADHDTTAGDLIYYTVPASIGAAYDPAVGPGRVSARTMDVNMKDASSQNFYLGIERQVAANFLVRVNYQGSLGRHLPVLMNLNRYDGLAYNSRLSGIPPNPRYSGFNYRANTANSNYNALVAEFQKRMSHGLQFQFGYTFSKLLDYNSDLFAGETATGQFSQPYYYVSNANPRFEYGPAGYDHTHSFKFNYVWELPFLRTSKGFAGKVLGGWQLSGFYQAYSGHPLQIYSSQRRYKGDATDSNGVPENLGGDYNLDGVYNDHPVYAGSGSPYSSGSPADGIFRDNNLIGCGFAGQLSSSAAVAACNDANGVTTPNSLFVNPPGEGVKFGMGRNNFRGPWFNNFDAAILKNFSITERVKLQFRAEAINALNHPNFDGIVTDVRSGNFGRAQVVLGDGGYYGPGGYGSWSNGVARRFQFALRLSF